MTSSQTPAPSLGGWRRTFSPILRPSRSTVRPVPIPRPGDCSPGGASRVIGHAHKPF
jgi:hypothetical protein